MDHYCQFCGNYLVPDRDKPCKECGYLLGGPLAKAYEQYVLFGETYRQCCGGLSYDKDHLYFHGKYFEGSYPEKVEEGDCHVWVEYGVKFYADSVQTYFIRDFDDWSDSEDYGKSISYDDPEFFKKLDAQLSYAPQAAWNSDLLTCSKCGYHYTEICKCQEDLGEDDIEQNDEI